VSPEFPQPTKRRTLAQHAVFMKNLIAQMAPKVVMFMVHNGHLPEKEWNLVRGVGVGVGVGGGGPH
jgi:hypothetical protein